MSDAGQEEMKRVLDFLKDHSARPDCEVCGHRGWFSVDSEHDPLKVLLPITAGGFYSTPRTGAGGMMAYVFVCTNCGNIRLHARVIVNPSQEGGRRG
jgi:hypothetical protein